MAGELTRRDALRSAVAAGGAALSASVVGPIDARSSPLPDTDAPDGAIVDAVLKLELTAVAAYEAAIRSGHLESRILATAKLLKHHEQEHAAALSTWLDKVGHPPAGRVQADAKMLARWAKARDQASILRLAIELENKAVADYYDAAGKLRDPGLLRTTAEIMASEGQHLVVLRQALGRNPAPEALVTDKRAD
jgi:rubrerythrin